MLDENHLKNIHFSHYHKLFTVLMPFVYSHKIAFKSLCLSCNIFYTTFLNKNINVLFSDVSLFHLETFLDIRLN